jgi:hypothetical protein
MRVYRISRELSKGVPCWGFSNCNGCQHAVISCNSPVLAWLRLTLMEGACAVHLSLTEQTDWTDGFMDMEAAEQAGGNSLTRAHGIDQHRQIR